MIEFYKSTIKERELKKINKFEIGSWINVINPNEQEIKKLTKNFNLDKENIYSGLDNGEIPRIEFLGDKCYIVLKIAPKNFREKLQTFLIVLSSNFILTLSKENLPFQELVKNNPTTQRLKLSLEIFKYVNENFEKFATRVIKEVNSKKRNLEKLTEKQINDLLEIEDSLNEIIAYFSYISLIYPKAIKKLNFYPEDKEFINDLIIDTEQKLNLCKLTLKNIANIRNRMIILSSRKLNKLITILTLFTVIITIPAAISGLYGMNISLPLSSNQNLFYYILAFIFIIWVIFIIYLKRKEFL